MGASLIVLGRNMTIDGNDNCIVAFVREHRGDGATGLFNPGIRRLTRRRLFQRLSAHPTREASSLSRTSGKAARSARGIVATSEELIR